MSIAIIAYSVLFLVIFAVCVLAGVAVIGGVMLAIKHFRKYEQPKDYARAPITARLRHG